MLLDLEVGKRQSFGVRFTRRSADPDDVQSIKDGKLLLTPHETWELPPPKAITWCENPFGDNNWLTQFHMLRWLDPLRREAERGDVEAAELWIKYAESWWAHNQPSSDLNRFVWEDMVDGIRTLVLVLGVPLVSKHRGEVPDWVIDALLVHVAWLKDGSHMGHGNHALHQHVGLFVASATALDEAGKDLAIGRLMRLFEASYDEQGVNAEGAVGYHLLNFKWWNDAVRRLKVEGVEIPEVFRRLDMAPEALAHSTSPTGKFVSFGDTDGGSPTGLSVPETDWVTSNGSAGEPPADNTALYESGYFFTRSGWGAEGRPFTDETFLAARFGPANRIHGHPDGGSVTFTANGIDWLVDPGKYQYGRHPMRAYCQSRSAHNLVSIPGKKYDRTSIVKCTPKSLSSNTHDLEFFDSGYAGISLKRRLVYSVGGEYFVVVDSVDSENRVTAVQNWQFGEDIEVETTSRGARVSSNSGVHSELRYMGTETEVATHCGSTDPLKGWISVGWKEAKSASSIELSKSGKKFRFISTFASGHRKVKPSIEPLKTGTPDILALKVSTGRVDELMVITPEGSRVVDPSNDPKVVADDIASNSSSGFDPRDHAHRDRVFSAIEHVYSRAWDTPVEERSPLSESLKKLVPLTSSDDVDLGVRAALADLAVPGGAEVGAFSGARSSLINWSGDTDFRTVRDGLSIISLRSHEVFPDVEQECVITRQQGSLVLPAYFCPGSGSVLTVLFHGALDRARTRLPVFERVRFQKSLGAGPTLAFADPTLDLSRTLRLGWYLGTEKVDLPRLIAETVKSALSQLGLSDTLLVGSSGGGFGALQAGALIPGANVLAFNPQTDLRNYYSGPYQMAVNAVFGAHDSNSVGQFVDRLDVAERIAQHRNALNITLVQNLGDKVHIRMHSDPLRNRIHEISEVSICTRSVDWGSGHRSPTNEEYHSIVHDTYLDLGVRIQ